MWSLCIDFGTAFSKAAAVPSNAWDSFDPSAVRPLSLGALQDGANPFLLESAVFVDERCVLFGEAAIERGDALAHQRRAALRSFKTLLSASDLDRALNTGAPPAVDPERVFPLRDLVVLYLAYLLAAVERGIANDSALAGARFERRYAAPAWRAGDSAGLHEAVLRLFGEAEAFRLAVGEDLLAPGGLPFELINEKLPAALDTPAPYAMGLIFEATAAAAYTSIDLADAASHLLVVDMGAGTTDITAMVRSRDGVRELADARLTLKQAGDHIDRIIANLFIEASPEARSTEEQTTLWRALMHHMRDIKESLFEDGRASVRGVKRAVSVSLRDLERHPDFRLFQKTLQQSYEHSFAVLRDSAKREKNAKVDVVAVGGGSSAPFLQALLKKPPSQAGKIAVTLRPATPEWAHAAEFEGNLAPVFPQLAIAIGGALAPAGMLAAGASPASGARSDNPGARG